MIAALRLARQNGASTVVCAIPVCPDEMRATLLENCDKLVTLLHPAWFSAVGEFYDEFPQLKDQDMEQLSPKNFKVPHHPTSDYHRGSQPNQTSGDIQR
jgi:predicted phosphoribosyltransferase